MPMLDFIDKILSCFESCFSRKAAFRWFVILTTGLMLRSDKLGVTFVIRDPALKPDCYLSMLHFFRASSWSLDAVRQRWFQTVLRFSPLYQEDGFHILVGEKGKVSEGAMMCYLRKHIFRFMRQSPELRITRLIQDMQESPEICEDLLAS